MSYSVLDQVYKKMFNLIWNKFIMSFDKLLKEFKNKNIELDIQKRWASGLNHHSKSIELFKHLEALDFEYGNDYFCFKSGGDGDNGEHLMYLLDIFFENEDLK